MTDDCLTIRVLAFHLELMYYPAIPYASLMVSYGKNVENPCPCYIFKMCSPQLQSAKDMENTEKCE